MNSRDTPFYDQVQLFEIQGNIVIARPKVASSTCSSITYNKFDKKVSYQRIRDLANYDMFDNDGKLDIQPQSNTIESKFKPGNNTVKHFFAPDNELEEKMIENVVSTFRNIVSGKSNKKIYILCREPKDHWSVGIYEDLKHALNSQEKEDVCNQLEKYFDDTQWKIAHKQLFYDYKKGQIMYYQNDTERNKQIYNLQKNPNFEIEHLYFYMKDRYLHDEVIRKDHGVAKFEEFKETYFRALWWMVINPFKTVEGVHRTSTRTSLYNMISQHYHPYLTKLWLLFSRTYYPEYVKWVDILTDNFKLIKRTSKLDYTNTRNHEIKSAWNQHFYHVARDANCQQPGYLEPEEFVFDTIKEYNKR